jgi:hypothetical protein
MTGLDALWLPIVLSAVFVFIVSAIIHMAPLWHAKSYAPVPNQEAARSSLRALNLSPGDYMVPRTYDMKEMKTPEYQAKMTEGPQMILTVLPNLPWQMGRTLGLWFVYSLVVSLFAAYVAGRALPAGAAYLDAFRFAGTTAFLGYTAALWQMWIWYGRGAGLTWRATLDGVIYALITAGVFGWLWPR